MQHMADNSAPLVILAVFPLPLLSGIQLLPVFQTQCPQHTNHNTPRAPLDCVLAELKKAAKGSLYCCTITMEDPPTQNEGKASGTAIITTSSKTVHREKIMTLTDFWIIAVVLYGRKGILQTTWFFFSITVKRLGVPVRKNGKIKAAAQRIEGLWLKVQENASGDLYAQSLLTLVR